MLRKKFFLFGLATWIPGVFANFSRPTGGSNSAPYCYSVWLRHLVRLHEVGYGRIPRTLAELGPGDSLGTGLAALISGVESYRALDAHVYSSRESDLAVFDELVEMFRRRQEIPNSLEYSRIRPALSDYRFPKDILSDDWMNTVLNENRLGRIRAALSSVSDDNVISYCAPWSERNVLERESVDLVIAQAAMQYVENLDYTYAAFNHWLVPGGVVALTIDYTAHHIATRWNEHWTYSPLLWWCLKGRQPYFLNRRPHTVHVSALSSRGFAILREERVRRDTAIDRSELSSLFESISEIDLRTSGGYIVAQKPRNTECSGRVGIDVKMY